MNPTKLMDKFMTIKDAWTDLAKDVKFAEQSAAEYAAEIQKSQTVRDEISDLENQLKQKMMERDALDEANWQLSQLVVLSVAGNPKFGKNSALYERMGYVATSERRSGLTRKKKTDGGAVK